MKIKIEYHSHQYSVDLNKGHDVSIPMIDGHSGPNCFYAPLFETSPLTAGAFVGDTRKGSPVNFFNVRLNPHGNGTHTECVGHITKERISINQCLKSSHFLARLISVYPQNMEHGDRCVLLSQLQDNLDNLNGEEAIILRTMPNHADKLKRVYSGTNPAYIEDKAMAYMRKKGIKHFLTDLPSVDREEDGGKLAAHKAFWNFPEQLDKEKTISEMLYIGDEIRDGIYLINIQIPPFELDAAPSRVLLFDLEF